MSKARKTSDMKKFLLILAVLVIVMTPLGKHALMDASNWVGKKVANSITHNLPNLPAATPSVTAKPSK